MALIDGGIPYAELLGADPVEELGRRHFPAIGEYGIPEKTSRAGYVPGRMLLFPLLQNLIHGRFDTVLVPFFSP